MMFKDREIRGALLLWLLLLPHSVTAQRDAVLKQLFSYPERVRSECSSEGHPCLPTDTFHANVYVKYYIDVKKRNFTMLTVPNLFHIAHGDQRLFFGEMYSTLVATDQKDLYTMRHLHVSTVRRRRSTLEHVRDYVSARPYGVTLVDDHLLSPFHHSNRHFYKYKVSLVDDSTALVSCKPRIANTQLVNAEATVDALSGRIIGAHIEGEYDMARFKLQLTMGESGVETLRVRRLDADVVLRFLGNRIDCSYVCMSNLPVTLPDTLINADSLQIMQRLRPVPLTQLDEHAIFHLDSLYAADVGEESDTTATTENRSAWVKETADAVWDVIQDNMLSSIRTGFGNAARHEFSIGPIFNPLYFDYSKSRGLIYRLSMDFQYRHSDNNRLIWEFRSGYSFKQHLFYFDSPLTWFFNERRNGFLQAAISNGNRIGTSDVLDLVKQLHRGDTIDFEAMNLTYFKDLSLRFSANYGFTKRLSGQLGFIFHRRSAVSHHDFHLMGQPTVYHTFAPLLEVMWRPMGDRGPVLSADWEQGLNGVMGGDIGYNRWEFDGQWIVPLRCTRSLSLRAGVGFYLSKSGQRYFLDYSNFRRNNIPGGWRDKYSGEFELLNDAWYNASDYYVRFNGTYESPLLMFSRLPWVGRIVERERIYLSMLAVRNYYPFTEFGYGFTNRLCSVATFFAFSPHGYEGFGFKFGFELFSNW